MIASAVIAVGCCLAAQRAVPWQGRQTVLVMGCAMIGLALAPDDPGVSLLVGALLLVSAMLGTGGLRGTPAARTCCHRALGSLVMAVCAFAGVAHGSVAVEPGHGAHLATDAVSALAAVGVLLLVGWTVADRFRPHAPTIPHKPRAGSRLLAGESWAMTVGVVVMWLAH